MPNPGRAKDPDVYDELLNNTETKYVVCVCLSLSLCHSSLSLSLCMSLGGCVFVSVGVFLGFLGFRVVEEGCGCTMHRACDVGVYGLRSLWSKA